MIKIILFYAFLALMLLVNCGLYWVLRKLSFPIGQRHLHIRYLVVLLLELVVFNSYLTVPVVDLLDWIITRPGLQHALELTRPGSSYEVLYLLLTVLGLNTVLLMATVLLCLAVRTIFGTKNFCFLEDEDYYGWKKIFFPGHKLVTRFFTSADAQWSVLNARGHCMGKWAGGMKWVFALLGVLQILVMAGSVVRGSEEWNATFRSVTMACYWLPMSGFLLSDQISAFLTDAPVFEVDRIQVRKKSATLVGKLNEQEAGYREVFDHAGALLCCKELQKSDRDETDITSDPGNQQLADCSNPELLTVLCQRLKTCGEATQSEHYQRALAALLDGKHINVCDQLEGEFFIYLTAYLNTVFSQGQTALILCKRSEDARILKAACQRNMSRLNSISTVWSVCTAREANQDSPMSLLICSYDELLTLRLLEIRREFAGVLKCVIIAHGERLFAQDNIRIRRLFNELQSYSTAVQYVLLSETDNDSLRTTMENFMGDGELLPFNTGFCQEETTVMVWKEESCHKLQNRIGLGGDLAPYMGTALPLALAAAKWDVPRTYIIPAEDRPDNTYWQCMCANMIDVENYLSNNADVNAVIRMDPAEALKPRQIKQLICYDTRCDFISVARSWSKYAGSNDTILHIISPHYLLREYFAEKFQAGMLPDQPVEALVSHSRVMDRSNMAALLVDLRDQGMTEKELLRRSREYGWDYQQAEDVLQACLSNALQGEEKPNIYEHFCFVQRLRQREQDGSLIMETFVTLTNPDAYESVLSQVRRACVQIGTEQRMEMPILAGDICNYYLREQQLVLDGMSYKVDDIRGDTVFVTQYSDRFAYEYFPVSRFGFDHYRITDGCVDSAGVNVNIVSARVDRQIYGYWKSNNGYQISGNGIFTFEDLAHAPVPEQKTVSILELKLSADQKKISRDVAVTLAFILNGLFKTIFPYTHQNLFAAVQGERDWKTLERSISKRDQSQPEKIIESLIPFVRGTDKWRPDDCAVYVVEYSNLEYGMVRMLYKNYNRILRTVQDYLTWYLSPREEGKPALSGSELNFGSEAPPKCFALQKLLDILKNITLENSPVDDEVPSCTDMNMQFAHTCAFCGQKAVIMYRLEDGRMMCNNCFDHQVNDREKIKTMVQRTRRFMEKEYGIQLSQDLRVRFKSTDELRHKTGAGVDQRLLGTYRQGGNQLWLESGGPEVSMKGALIHELTRCWQYNNLPLSALREKLPAEDRDRQLQLLLEGHAFFVEVQTLHLMQETAYANRQDRMLMNRTDVGAEGYRRLKQYFHDMQEAGHCVNAVTVMKHLTENLLEGRETVR